MFVVRDPGNTQGVWSVGTRWRLYGSRRGTAPGGVVRAEPQFDQVAPTPYTLLVRALVALIRHARDQVTAAASGWIAEGTSSTGRASVSKTEGWGFKSLVPCKS